MADTAPPSPEAPRLSVSVAIRSRTDSDEVLRLIDALAAQSAPPAEIVDIDSGSAPEIIEALRRFSREGVPSRHGAIPLRLIEIPSREFSSAGALNRLIEAARGELIAIVSQDALPADAEYLARLAVPFEKDDVAGTYARQILADEYDPLGEKDLEKTYPPVSKMQGRGECWFVNTCSMVRRSLWEHHPFDDGAWVSEDHEWGKWATDSGFRIAYVAEAVVRHYHPFRRLSQLWGRYYAEGRGLAHVHGRGLGLWRAATSWIREVLSDGLWLTRRGKVWHWPRSWWRRGVKHAALWKGHRDERREMNDETQKR